MRIMKVLVAGVAALGFIALAACTEGDPGAAPPAEQAPAQPLD
jgi:hypothetical protein